jgi:NitT/TauT family transport system ATP-binding protein
MRHGSESSSSENGVMAAALELVNVTKRFDGSNSGDALTAIKSVSFEIAAGQFVSVVGPSGCGKSTILNLVAGLDRPSEGEVRIEGVPVRGPNAKVAFMLQKDLLLPWRTIVRNVEFGLEARNVPSEKRRERALRELERCRLTGFSNSYPFQLSGGMRQRAALARTLAVDPEIVLLDEPFSALDAQTKIVLQRSFAATIAEAGITALLITHDLSEAVMMSDQVLVMSERPGQILEKIDIDLPGRDDPIARGRSSAAQDYIKHIFEMLHLDEKR